MNLCSDKDRVKNFYDQHSEKYIQMYSNGYEEYPENLIRLNMIIDRMKQNKIKTILDAGCGTCGPMIRLLREGFIVKGFDFSQQMVEEGKKELKKEGLCTEIIFKADLEHNKGLPDEKFDAILALGVLPHATDEVKALSNIRERLQKDGTVFISFRNILFSAYTMNRYSLDFFLNQLLDMKSLPEKLHDELSAFYSNCFQADKTLKIQEDTTGMLYKFHNPLCVNETLFRPSGLSVDKIHFYHYHALPPCFEKSHPKVFKELSLTMEKPDDWRGYFMASAFVVEARRYD